MNQYPAKPLMDEMAQYGRYGDSMLVHMNPIEVAGIASLSPTGQLTTNPVTGQPEAFLPLLAPALGILGGALKLSPLMTGALTGIGTAAVTGDLKRGLLAGLSSGIMSGVGEGVAEAFKGGADAVAQGTVDTAGTAFAGGVETAGDIASTIQPDLIQAPEGILKAAEMGLPGAPGTALTSPDMSLVGVDASGLAPPPEPSGISALSSGVDRLVGGLSPMQATMLAGIPAGQMAQMDVEDDLAAQAAAREAEREEKLAQAYGDLYGAQMAAQPGLAMGMSPRRSIMSDIIPYRPTMGMSAGGSTSLTPYLQDLVDRGVLTEEQARQQMEARGDAAQNEDLEQVTDVAQGTDTQGAGAGTNVYDRHDDILDDEDLRQSGPQGAGNNPDYIPPDTETETETETETTTRRPTTRANTPMQDIGFLGREEEILNKAKMGNVLTQEEQAILERYYNRYEDYRRRRDERFKEMDRQNANFIDFQALAQQAGGFFGYTPEGGTGIDPVSVQAGLRGQYSVAPPKDYMAGFEPEFTYFQDDPNAPFIPDRGYRPISGGIESSGGYFDPILDRGEYNRQLMDYYTMLGSYMPGAVEYPEEAPPIEDDPDTVGTPIGGGAGELPDVEEPVDVDPDEVDPEDARDRIKRIRARLGGKEGMKGILKGILSGDSELARQHRETQARYLPPEGSAAYNRLSPEEQEAIDMERDRRYRAAQRQRREYIESVGGYGNYEGGFNDADYWNAGYANLDDAYYYGGQIKPASETTTSVEMQAGGEVPIRTPMGETTVPAGGIANMPTEFSASMPTEQEFNMLISAIAGQADNADQIIEMFIERYGVDMFSQIREMVLQSIVPNAQTEGMIEGNGSGMDDMVGGMIGDQQPVAVSPGEYIVPADVVSGLGDGSSDAGAEELDQMMSRVRMARGGTTEQAPPIDAKRMMPA